jgi:hypothetical protein
LNNSADLPSIAEFLRILNNGDIGPIIAAIETVFNENAFNIEDYRPHQLLAGLNAPVIYTTNYDRILERVYDYLQIPCQVIITTADIIKMPPGQHTQIIKYHGSFEQPASMVLTESDYFERLEYETPVDIKLRADILGKSLLFLGYSFSDFNIRYLWFKLRKMMRGVDEAVIPGSYILLSRANRMMATYLEAMGITPLYLNDFTGKTKTEQLCRFLDLILQGR